MARWRWRKKEERGEEDNLPLNNDLFGDGDEYFAHYEPNIDILLNAWGNGYSKQITNIADNDCIIEYSLGGILIDPGELTIPKENPNEDNNIVLGVLFHLQNKEKLYLKLLNQIIFRNDPPLNKLMNS